MDTGNEDTNAAKNILRKGLSRLACPEKGVAHIGHRETRPLDRSLKQKIRSRLVAHDALPLGVSEAENPRLTGGDSVNSSVPSLRGVPSGVLRSC